MGENLIARTTEMEASNVQQRLIDAETKLSRALQRLHALRRAALYGNYDPVEFDRAVMSYREAEAEVQQAREAWAHVHQGAPAPAPVAVAEQAAEEEAPNEPFVITPRLQFAKWLVENGRLSDWPQEEKIAA
jgi:hypothetical protein